MNEKEQKIKQAMKNSAASLAVDGHIVTKEMSDLVYRKLKGEITHEQFMAEALRMTSNKEKEM
ncbi:antitoxin VbhA family protein [Neobacillus sp. MER 74]|uniref:antitoxin VbhA family protein n=1 Tax=Neobacillus sp. MER 74 TaxID=2939566 RepID=UPI00203F3462|nr:antitoxin VbhA family protein [Neobacillus sp. MER 74]MCM3118800.1 antitoxin VbhA family protein [Neobacillus sp. MER 74]